MVDYHPIISIKNLLAAWKEFLLGKKQKHDVQAFSSMLMGNLTTLHDDLANFSYIHGSYKHFKINDPKPRDIHKASVRDRLLHHAIYRMLYPFFDRTFISDSFSCRLGKGTHKALRRFRVFAYQASQNDTRTCWILKCDIRKFFENINHQILLEILRSYIPDVGIIWLLERVTSSFEKTPGVGLPLGNLTSQLFVNIYMNEFDQFVKHRLKIKHYLRYADDFVILSQSKSYLENLIPLLRAFLKERLKLELHPNKVYIKTLNSGLDFLGWVNFPDHRVLRTSTRRRMLSKLEKNKDESAVNSYLGLLKHGNTYKLRQNAPALREPGRF